MAGTIFLAFDGVEGESTDDRHKGEIQLESWSFGVSNSGTTHLGGGGAGAGKASVSDLAVTKSIDLATPALLQAAASGKRAGTATLTARKAGEGQRDFLKVVMRDVMVTSCTIDADGDSGMPREAVHLSFGTVQLTYTAQSADGSEGPTRTFGWHVARNSPV